MATLHRKILSATISFRINLKQSEAVSKDLRYIMQKTPALKVGREERYGPYVKKCALVGRA